MMRDRRRSAREKRAAEEAEQAREAARKVWHKPHAIAWCMVAASTLLLFSLSIWQLQRLAWKEGLINTITSYQYERAYGGLPEDTTNIEELSFARILLHGEFLHEHEVHLAARYYNSQLGYHILTPFKLTDERLVLLNRGWVHVDNKDPATRMEGQVEGLQHVVGMIRTDNDRNSFTPDNDVENNIWFWRDVAGIIEATNLPLYPVTLDILYDIPAGNQPIPSDGLIRLRNDHLSYAITWFLIGLSGIIIFATYHYRSRETQEPVS